MIKANQRSDLPNTPGLARNAAARYAWAVNEIPQHTRHLLERLLSAYCERICPPRARHPVLLRHRVETDRATLFELRSICGVPGTVRPVQLAQFRYCAATEDWQFLINTAPFDAPPDEPVRWRRYALLPRSRNVIDLLREFDADPKGLLWGRVNGKSLRWCRSEGRCDDCDERYCRVLGTRHASQAARVREAT
jgi:hypothetical protein